jgi:hypothetical protein
MSGLIEDAQKRRVTLSLRYAGRAGGFQCRFARFPRPAKLEHIGQIHFADVPGRHEPGTGEINFRNVFRAIHELGDRYPGYVTAEYHPADLSFRDLERVR